MRLSDRPIVIPRAEKCNRKPGLTRALFYCPAGAGRKGIEL
nr:MAG TPA: hypothetical protein [Bacteriophage sp.]DAZ04624.1 MAG TPA: hypothetical protein [Caudoviricetes sp.]